MKDKQINIRLTKELYNMLIMKSEASNLSYSNFLRSLIINTEIKIDNSRDISKLIGSVNKMGNNLNQIAHTLNVANNKDKLDDIEYDKILNELILIEQYLKELIW